MGGPSGRDDFCRFASIFTTKISLGLYIYINNIVYSRKSNDGTGDLDLCQTVREPHRRRAVIYIINIKLGRCHATRRIYLRLGNFRFYANAEKYYIRLNYIFLYDRVSVWVTGSARFGFLILTDGSRGRELIKTEQIIRLNTIDRWSDPFIYIIYQRIYSHY